MRAPEVYKVPGGPRLLFRNAWDTYHIVITPERDEPLEAVEVRFAVAMRDAQHARVPSGLGWGGLGVLRLPVANWTDDGSHGWPENTRRAILAPPGNFLGTAR